MQSTCWLQKICEISLELHNNAIIMLVKSLHPPPPGLLLGQGNTESAPAAAPPPPPPSPSTSPLPEWATGNRAAARTVAAGPSLPPRSRHQSPWPRPDPGQCDDGEAMPLNRPGTLPSGSGLPGAWAVPEPPPAVAARRSGLGCMEVAWRHGGGGAAARFGPLHLYLASSARVADPQAEAGGAWRHGGGVRWGRGAIQGGCDDAVPSVRQPHLPSPPPPPGVGVPYYHSGAFTCALLHVPHLRQFMLKGWIFV